VAELDEVKKAAIAAAISAYLSEEGVVTAVFRPTMFLRSIEGAGPWGRLSRKSYGGSKEYRREGLGGRRMFFGDTRR
jgi:hypothetical protein